MSTKLSREFGNICAAMPELGTKRPLVALDLMFSTAMTNCSANLAASFFDKPCQRVSFSVIRYSNDYLRFV